MGRTQRKRKRRKPRTFQACNDCKEIVLLNTWLAERGVIRNKNLALAVFQNTGRGVLTTGKISTGDELLNLPLNLTINVTSILSDIVFCKIFLENDKQCLLEYQKMVSFQSLMAFYLTYLKVQGTESFWSIYIESLPKEYTVPYFLPKMLRHYIDGDILTIINKQEAIIAKSYNIFLDILNGNKSNISTILKLRDNFCFSSYEWAYFTINTRCVYMDLTKLIDLKNVKTSILNILSDNTNISLCPYLDMINHSPDAKNVTQLIVGKNIENMVCLEDIDPVLFSDVRFSIYTKNNFDPYEEVFICYGDSHNLKLITEYGFYLPNNDLDCVAFTFHSVKEFLKSNSIKLSQDQLSFIDNHGLNKDLYIDCRGLSFNFCALLMVVKYYYDKSVDVSRLIYSAAVCASDKILYEFIRPMVRDKLDYIRESLIKLRTCDLDSIPLHNCVALMCQYVNILEKFIKC